MNLIKMALSLFTFIVFLAIAVLETLNSDPATYRSKIESELTSFYITLEQVKCTERTRTANSLELIAKENGLSLFAYAGNKCRELAQKLSAGDVVFVTARLSWSEVLGIQVNGETLLRPQEIIENKIKNYNNYNIVYFVLSLSFLLYFISLFKNRTNGT